MRSHCELHRHRPWSAVHHHHHQAVDVLLLLLPHQDAFGGAENPLKVVSTTMHTTEVAPCAVHCVSLSSPLHEGRCIALPLGTVVAPCNAGQHAMHQPGSMTSSEGSQRAQRLSCQTRAKRAGSGRFHIPPKHWLASTRRHWSRHYLVARRQNSRTR